MFALIIVDNRGKSHIGPPTALPSREILAFKFVDWAKTNGLQFRIGDTDTLADGHTMEVCFPDKEVWWEVTIAPVVEMQTFFDQARS